MFLISDGNIVALDLKHAQKDASTITGWFHQRNLSYENSISLTPAYSILNIEKCLQLQLAIDDWADGAVMYAFFCSIRDKISVTASCLKIG